MGELLIVSREEVAAHLDYRTCIALMREAMAALSAGGTRQSLRTIIDLDGGRAFGAMPGAMDAGAFGAKLISVFPAAADGTPSHQGVVTLFDPANGAPVAIWGRSAEKAEALRSGLDAKLGCEVRVFGNVAAAVAEADIICTTTAAREPILSSTWVRDGTHVNAVGSSRAGPSEIDNELVRRARFFADHREGVIRQGAEFIRARDVGLIDDTHILGEIGEVFAGTLAGRTGPEQVTLYKSLGSIVQDLASGWYLVGQARKLGFGRRVPF